jgi:hypothetical protein
MRRAWRESDYPRALEQLTRLADELERTHPGAAGSLREGMQETLTVIRVGIKGTLRRTLESTNACESMIDTVRTTQRNVKHWSSGEMGMRWTAAGMLEAEKQFRKGIGYTDLPRLAGRDRAPTPPLPAQHRTDPGGRDRSHYVTTTPGPSSPKFHGDRGKLAARRCPGLATLPRRVTVPACSETATSVGWGSRESCSSATRISLTMTWSLDM